jgi:flagellar protein FlaG
MEKQVGDMQNPQPPRLTIMRRPDWRENYCNSVQIRVNVWDFFLQFGTIEQPAADHVEITNFQGIYLSPQQAKALLAVLQQNVTQYEQTFGEIKLDPRMTQPAAAVQ